MHGHAHRHRQELDGEQRGKGTLQEFREHAVAFVTINGCLVVLNLTTSPHYLWALWPLFGWGIGFVTHAAQAYRAFQGERAAALDSPVAPALIPPSGAEQERPWPDLEEG